MKFIKAYRLSFIGIMTKLFTANIYSQKENIVNKVNDLKLKDYRSASIYKIPVRMSLRRNSL